MCFVWISEQTAIISLYSINWLICITETQCVFCAVRTGFLKITLMLVFRELNTNRGKFRTAEHARKAFQRSVFHFFHSSRAWSDENAKMCTEGVCWSAQSVYCMWPAWLPDRHRLTTVWTAECQQRGTEGSDCIEHSAASFQTGQNVHHVLKH